MAVLPWPCGAILAGFALLSGCASPAPPLPPTLNLPQVVPANGLSAIRVGDEVRLHWTTPSRTTDKLTIRGLITAEICRQMLPAGAASAASESRNAGKVAAPPCSPVVDRVQVAPGPSDAADTLPAADGSASGPARVAAYRVQLRNAEGVTAGPSAAVFAALGAAPAQVENLSAKATKAGVVLEWRQVRGAATQEGEAVELERSTLEIPAASGSTRPAALSTQPAAQGSRRQGGLPGAAAKEPLESHFRAGINAGGADAGGLDSGGTIDRSARIGHTYRYTAQRVRSVTLGGRIFEVRSVPSASVTVLVNDVFPPEAPSGLVAVPGYLIGEQQKLAGQQKRPTIDLSWEPNLEPRMGGYRIYRRDLDGESPDVWRRIDSAAVPAYRDQTVVAARRYAYRVTAVSDAGVESPPSGEASETSPAAQ
jgi:fibronectin type 3 domain-containing protein